MEHKSPLRYLIIACILLFVGSLSLQAQYRGVSQKDEGFTNVTELGAYLPFETYESGFGAQTLFGYLQPQFFVGAGPGIEVYGTEAWVSVIADGRYFFIDGPTTPFLFGEGGYAINIDPKGLSGVLFSAGLGMRFFLSNNFALNTSIGYRGINFLGVDPVTSPSGSSPLGAFTLKAGFQL